MVFNPLSKLCENFKNQIDELCNLEKKISNDLFWYKNTDLMVLNDEQKKNKFISETLEIEIQTIDTEIKFNDLKIGEILPKIKTLFNPFNWFAKDQVDFRRICAELRNFGKAKSTLRQSIVKKLDDVRAKILQIINNIERYRSFDPVLQQSTLLKLKEDIEEKKNKLELTSERKRRIDEVLAPLLQEMQNMKLKISKAESVRNNAQDLDHQLSSAKNSYQRAKIHEKCDNEFGEGSPRKIIIEREKEIRQIQRDFEKAKFRVEKVAQKVARNINTIVIDGNNLCYEGGVFIGLAALVKLLPVISRISSVVVVFDSAICSILNTSSLEVQKRLGSFAKVHVVASKQLADETVLDLACMNENFYVLSNDRFGDFNEKAVVKYDRIIRHEIINGNIFIHDLQLRLTYV